MVRRAMSLRLKVFHPLHHTCISIYLLFLSINLKFYILMCVIHTVYERAFPKVSSHDPGYTYTFIDRSSQMNVCFLFKIFPSFESNSNHHRLWFVLLDNEAYQKNQYQLFVLIQSFYTAYCFIVRIICRFFPDSNYPIHIQNHCWLLCHWYRTDAWKLFVRRVCVLLSLLFFTDDVSQLCYCCQTNTRIS